MARNTHDEINRLRALYHAEKARADHEARQAAGWRKIAEGSALIAAPKPAAPSGHGGAQNGLSCVYA